MPVQPRLGLGDGVKVQILAVRNRDGLPHLAENVVRQLIDGLRHGDGADLLLHIQQLGEGKTGVDASGLARLLLPEDGKALSPVGNIHGGNL